MSQTYLFMLSIGPVQSFITQARKTQDLYGASQLLSDLCKIGAETFEKKAGILIYPTHLEATVSNRFVGQLDSEDVAELRKIGNEVAHSIENRLTKIAADTIQQGKKELAWLNEFDDQIKRHLEIYWVFVPLKSDYAQSYKALLRAMIERKKQKKVALFEETGRKCALDGISNALFYRLTEGENKKDLPATLTLNLLNYPRGNKLNPGEALGAMGMIKRTYKSEYAFPSTAEVALMDVLHQLKAKHKYQSITGMKSLLKDDFDAQLLYRANHTDSYFRKNGIDPGLLNEHISLWKKFKQECQSENLRINDYYAILVFDGDEAGKWLSGEFLQNDEVIPDFQSFLSGCLSQFAAAASKELSSPKGRAIYAGGDDFVGFINLNYLFEVIKTLRKLFDTYVTQPLHRDYGSVMHDPNKVFTFSAGVAVAHYSQKLSKVITQARELEAMAKLHQKGETTVKDAFTLGVVRNSDQALNGICTLGWALDETSDSETISLLQRILLQFHPKVKGEHGKRNAFSNAFINYLQHEMAHLGIYVPLPSLAQDRIDELLIAKIPRAVSQACLTATAEAPELKAQLTRDLVALFGLFQDSFPSNPKQAVLAFLNTLDTLDFISTHINPIVTTPTDASLPH